VPDAAIFNAAENEWELGERRGDKQIGAWTWWRPDGTLVCKSPFDDRGELDGVCRRYHPDGTISMESRYVHGVRWGKTWHTRSARGDSPEDGHVAQLPAEVCRLEMVYINGQMVPMMLATLRAEGRDKPPELRAGQLQHMKRDLPKYHAGTAFMVIGGITDVAKRKLDARVLFFDGPAMEDYSVLRFAFAPPGARKSTKPAWQDPDYGTAISIDEAARKLFVAVDGMDTLIVGGQPPARWGLRVEPADAGVRVRGAEPGGLAERADLADGDLIVAANGHPVDSTVSYIEALRDANRVRSLELRIRRGSEERTVTIRE
jgi:hypothetical protein